MAGCRKGSEVRADSDVTEDVSLISPREDKKNVLEDALGSVVPKRKGFQTYWGPVGFNKLLHPLSIMV